MSTCRCSARPLHCLPDRRILSAGMSPERDLHKLESRYAPAADAVVTPARVGRVIEHGASLAELVEELGIRDTAVIEKVFLSGGEGAEMRQSNFLESLAALVDRYGDSEIPVEEAIDVKCLRADGRIKEAPVRRNLRRLARSI